MEGGTDGLCEVEEEEEEDGGYELIVGLEGIEGGGGGGLGRWWANARLCIFNLAGILQATNHVTVCDLFCIPCGIFKCVVLRGSW